MGFDTSLEALSTEKNEAAFALLLAQFESTYLGRLSEPDAAAQTSRVVEKAIGMAARLYRRLERNDAQVLVMLLQSLHHVLTKVVAKFVDVKAVANLVSLVLSEIPQTSWKISLEARHRAVQILLRLVTDRKRDTCDVVAAEALHELARGVPDLDDYELQESTLDALYMLWRAWSRRARDQAHDAADALLSALHPKLCEAMVTTCAFLSSQLTRCRRRAVLARQGQVPDDLESCVSRRSRPHSRGAMEGRRTSPSAVDVSTFHSRTLLATGESSKFSCIDPGVARKMATRRRLSVRRLFLVV